PQADASQPINWPEIPGYRIEGILHQGTTAIVYRARQLALDRPVAIKVLHTVPLQDRHTAAPWLGEALLRAKLNHPNIVSVYDAGRTGDDVYFVMEYVAGKSLRERMRPGRPWRIRRALNVLQAVTAALEYIHARGLLHLDLKPENVLLTECGQAKITDFGISRWIHHDQADGLILGTCDYCAPEQRFGLGVDRRADVFSLAVLAYELLTGYVPGRVYVSARRWHRLLPGAVDNVLAKGLARDKEERYDSAAAFYRDLERVLLDYRQHPIWGSLAALSIAAVVAIPLLIQQYLAGTHRTPGNEQPCVSPSSAEPPNGTHASEGSGAVSQGRTHIAPESKSHQENGP
ncbi:MAG: serine/threonine-protein kinase, partial [Gemmatales bacterium]|nr:serine/threonine protein kinase [Gemmatales bacterium]MDW8174122.1 serine/threonine-protein kinase [Gemmatales bacterium]